MILARGATILLATLLAFSAMAATPGKPASVSAPRDGITPGWKVSTSAPSGWTADCCTYAKAIGVNFVIYQGEWTGEPNRVMVLNVWPRKLPSLTAEWQADQKHYLQHDPLAKVVTVALPHTPMPCHGLLYQGTDHIDDIVVFCDPGKRSGVRLSWSMTVAANDPRRQEVTALFQQVVEASSYQALPDKPVATAPAPAH
ncbi:hypothetical protein [Rhodanobacter sp. L36]|uniref:hypothetical protein n=1 Tax=Rhodanobacter sp. L36 TaxID=1747221 RepID=UPI00131BBD2A|nr:hypothetical protein [Rhodanobacter sp. L36]